MARIELFLPARMHLTLTTGNGLALRVRRTQV
jgi:hypothetical protein